MRRPLRCHGGRETHEFEALAGVDVHREGLTDTGAKYLCSTWSRSSGVVPAVIRQVFVHDAPGTVADPVRLMMAPTSSASPTANSCRYVSPTAAALMAMPAVAPAVSELKDPCRLASSPFSCQAALSSLSRAIQEEPIADVTYGRPAKPR